MTSYTLVKSPKILKIPKTSYTLVKIFGRLRRPDSMSLTLFIVSETVGNELATFRVPQARFFGVRKRNEVIF